MEKLRSSTPIMLWVLIFSFGLLWVLADTQFFDAIMAGPQSLGSVNGESISLEEYNSRVSSYINQYNQQGIEVTSEVRANIENRAWEDLVTSKLIRQKMDELGITVTDQEVVNMISGPNPVPFIRQQFQREDGTIDRGALRAAIEAPENSEIWLMVEQQLREQRRQQKMSTYIQAGLRVSNYEVEQTFIRNNTFADVSFVRFPYSEIPDAEIEVTEQELRNYYRQNRDQYRQDESYRFSYVSFDKSPTAKDTARTIRELRELRDDFAEVEDDSLFLERYQSVTPYQTGYVAKDEIRDEFRPVLQVGRGEVTEVISTGSRVHILKKIDETGSRIRFVTLSFDITADPISTIDARAEEADDFSFYAEEEGFEAEVENQGLEIREGFATKGNTFVSGLGQSRQLLDFLENASRGEISEPLELSSEFVVVKVNEITPKGYRPFEEVSDQIRPVVLNEKRKERAGEQARNLLSSVSSLEELAETTKKEVMSANIRMNALTLPGAGREPEIIGVVFGLPTGELSKPVKGRNAIFVLRVDGRTEADLANLDSSTRVDLRQQLEQIKAQAYNQVWLEELKEEASITDNRRILFR